MKDLDKNEAWDLVKLHNGRKIVGSKWVIKKKLNATRKVEMYKAQLVEKGYSQLKGIDFGDFIYPIENLTSIRILLPLPTNFDLEVEKMDVKKKIPTWGPR